MIFFGRYLWESQDLLRNDLSFENLTLVGIVYGEDEEKASKEATSKLLEAHPDLKVICAPTAAGIPGVAKAVSEAGSDIKVTGLGMPSQMAEYIRDDLTSPCVYLWNPQDLGRLAAYTCLGKRSIKSAFL